MIEIKGMKFPLDRKYFTKDGELLEKRELNVVKNELKSLIPKKANNQEFYLLKQFLKKLNLSWMVDDLYDIRSKAIYDSLRLYVHSFMDELGETKQEIIKDEDYLQLDEEERKEYVEEIIEGEKFWKREYILGVEDKLS